MKGRFSVYMEEGTQFFFHTTCEVERTKDRILLTFEEDDSQFMHRVHSIGITHDSIAIMRSTSETNVLDDTPMHNSELALLTQGDPKYSKLGISLNGFNVYLFADDLKIVWQEEQVRVCVKCIVRADRKISEEHTLFFVCSMI